MHIYQEEDKTIIDFQGACLLTGADTAVTVEERPEKYGLTITNVIIVGTHNWKFWKRIKFAYRIFKFLKTGQLIVN